MAIHINGQTAHHSSVGFAWRERLDASVLALRHKLQGAIPLISLMGLITSFCSTVIWLGAAVTGQSNILGMVLMGLLCLGSACAMLALGLAFRR